MFIQNLLHSTSRRPSSACVLRSLRALILLAPALAFSAFAQQAPPDQPAQNAVPQPQAATSNDHVFDLIPNFLTLENAGNVPPLTTGGKFKAVARGVFDWGEFIWVAGVSGVGQWENSEPGFHQGWEGYGKRYAANYGDSAIENFMVGAVLPSILKQIPPVLSDEPRLIPAPPGLRRQPDSDYARRFGLRAVQFLGGFRERHSRGNLHLHLSSS